jgi:hypothetical protein
MGYFPNGTSGQMYKERYCDHCAHGHKNPLSCPIWYLHWELNYDQMGDQVISHVLSQLIPRGEDGFNEACSMFLDMREEDEATLHRPQTD